MFHKMTIPVAVLIHFIQPHMSEGWCVSRQDMARVFAEVAEAFVGTVVQATPEVRGLEAQQERSSVNHVA
jgi:hypothetical protein